MSETTDRDMLLLRFSDAPFVVIADLDSDRRVIVAEENDLDSARLHYSDRNPAIYRSTKLGWNRTR